ncbi:hypothetical protein V3C99_009542 [Haemonchus contortus]
MAPLTQSKRMLVACGVLLLQANLLLTCTFYQSTEPYQGELKYKVNHSSFDQCAKQCLYDLDCIYVSYVENTRTAAGVICSIYMSSTSTTVVDGKLFRINRKVSNSTCGNAVRCAAPQQYKKITAPERIQITPKSSSINMPQSLQSRQSPVYSPTSVYVYVSEEGFHAYSTSGTSPMLSYSQNCTMMFGGESEACPSVPVFTRGDYLRLYFGEEYNKTGYIYTSMTAFEQYCNVLLPPTCFSFRQIREYRNKNYYDFVYLEKPPPDYIETDVNNTFWICSDCF